MISLTAIIRKEHDTKWINLTSANLMRYVNFTALGPPLFAIKLSTTIATRTPKAHDLNDKGKNGPELKYCLKWRMNPTVESKEPPRVTFLFGPSPESHRCTLAHATASARSAHALPFCGGPCLILSSLPRC